MYITEGLPKEDEHGNRLYFARGLYVSRDGKTIYNLQDNSCYAHYYRPHPDKTGRLYIRNYGKNLYVDELVAACYKPRPKDDQEYTLIHKDGDIKNSHFYNLEWQLVKNVPYTVNMDQKCEVDGLTVKSDGTVYKGRNKLNIHDHMYDSDTDLFVTIRIHVFNNDRRVSMDDLMEKARFVHGDRDNIAHPKILHKDHNPTNYNRDNLEWVDENSQGYLDYLIDYRKWVYNNNIKINPGKRFPDFMQPKI